jgi:hypothetical protein
MKVFINIWLIFFMKFFPWNILWNSMKFHEIFQRIFFNEIFHGIAWKKSWIHGTIFASWTPLEF